MGTFDSNISTGTSTWYTIGGCNCTCSTPSGTLYYNFVPVQTVRKLVKLPARWKQKGKDAFVKMVNDETSVGWKVTLIIHGKVEVLDPNVEQISMKQFIALMRWDASQKDKAAIDTFTKKFKP